MMLNNQKEYEKSKNYKPKALKPLPLTFIKSFNLSSNNKKALQKKGIVHNDHNQINMFIKNLMEKREEAASEINKAFNENNTSLSFSTKKFESKYKLSTDEKEYQNIISYPKFKAREVSSNLFGGSKKIVNNDISLFEGIISKNKNMSVNGIYCSKK